ncbi:MAG: NERD domain-containing protein [Gammaproteobacteria bacterium]|nr:NERD domain-containing protein [Gammaproteobacteria bacterium]MDH5591728.1 NERD domain-containing protein [Gammaproteobacteria bacterium]
MTINPYSTETLAVIVILLLVFIITKLFIKRKRSVSYQMASILKPYARDEIKEFIIPDGVGGLLEVEHLVLMDQGLLLIKTYPYSGNLFGAENIEQWTQIIDGRSFKFINPLYHIHSSRLALTAVAPKVPVYCRIVYTGNSVFPKGKPDEVSVLSSLADDLQLIKDEPTMPDRAQHGWDTILRIARKNGKAVKGRGTVNG